MRFLRVLSLSVRVSRVFPFLWMVILLRSASESRRSISCSCSQLSFQRCRRVQNRSHNLRASACIDKMRHSLFNALGAVHKVRPGLIIEALIRHVLGHLIEHPSLLFSELRINRPFWWAFLPRSSRRARLLSKSSLGSSLGHLNSLWGLI